MSDGKMPLNVRAHFPLLAQKVRGRNLLYLDSAATSLKPWPVIERLSHFYTYETANIHRGAHFLADKATQAFEESRVAVQKFIGAQAPEEIIFTKGTTEAINLVAHSWGLENIQAGDEILLSEMEHHANFVPWQILAQKKSAKVVAVAVDELGQLSFADFQKKLSKNTKIVALTHCSNTLGTINDIQQFIHAAKQFGAMTLVDGAQFVPLRKLDVQELGCDFYAFSGHKLFAPYGVGVLYGKRTLLEAMVPYQSGGNMIADVSLEKTTFQNSPHKFEAGTPNIGEVIALKTALDYVHSLGWQNIQAHEDLLLHQATSRLEDIKGLRILGKAEAKAPILSFAIEGLHHADIGQILDQENIAVRVGHHCTLPLMKRFAINGTVRASFSIYNDLNDVDKLVGAVLKAKELLS